MIKLAHLLVVLPFVVFQLTANAQDSAPDFVHLIGQFPISHSVDESVQVNIAVAPRRKFEEHPLITYRLALLGGSPLILNVVDDTVSLIGFGTFTIKYKSDQPNGQASIDVNGQELCCVDVVNNRMTYLINVQRGKTAKFLAGGEFPIPVATRATATTVVFDLTTGATRGVNNHTSGNFGTIDIGNTGN